MDGWIRGCAIPAVNLKDFLMFLSLSIVWFLLRREKLTKRQVAYREGYLKSEHWQEVRKEKLKQAGYKCERCGAKESLDIHHLHYRTLGHERMSDLQALCRSCHQKVGRE
jgi:5-methylcytosine-specific restriction endonuclease McrA